MQEQAEGPGQAVRARRLGLGWTIDQAADAAGISDTTWVNIEHDRKVADLSMASALRALDEGEEERRSRAGTRRSEVAVTAGDLAVAKDELRRETEALAMAVDVIVDFLHGLDLDDELVMYPYGAAADELAKRGYARLRAIQTAREAEQRRPATGGEVVSLVAQAADEGAGVDAVVEDVREGHAPGHVEPEPDGP